MIIRLVVVFSAIAFSHVQCLFIRDYPPSNKCGYESCRKARADALNVHLVPHSHDDVGWLKTVDQYFYGTKSRIQRGDVNAIITSVVHALKENPERRFIQVETAFFHEWWHQQSKDIQEDVQELVANGQLEFTGGAWSMNDEGAAHYQSIVDQFTFALKFLNDTFGECGRPRVGWQIDPFGHSSEMASIFAQMSYDGVFFARLDWRDKMQRLQELRAEMIWQGSQKLGNVSNIFTSVLFDHYSAPNGFCFDVLCNEDPIVTNEQSSEYNYREKVEKFAHLIAVQAANYRTNNILVTMGDDFHYQDAITYYRNMDSLIGGFKRWPQRFHGTDINVFYSTPACYVKAVNDAVNARHIKLPLETYDFFPYASDYHAYWTGYYTSRPTSKRLEKSSNNLLQVHKQLATFTRADADEFFELQKAVAIMQHHDAITGTEKQHVADDYTRIMCSAIMDSGAKINKHISKLLINDITKPGMLNLKQCLMRNATVCEESNSNAFMVVVYNPLASKTRYPVRLPVNHVDFTVLGPNDEMISYQVSPSIAFNSKEKHGSKYELTFIARLDGLGMKVFRIQKMFGDNHIVNEDLSESRFQLGNTRLSVLLDRSTGLLDAVSCNGIELKTRQELLYYISSNGNNTSFNSRASGAYIFRNANDTIAQRFGHKVRKLTTYKGELFDEVHQVFNDWAKQTIRVYHDKELTEHIEFEWYIGPIPVEDEVGKEVISRFSTELKTSVDFYTDSNGREMIHRKRNLRPTFNYTMEEPIAGNYYPVTTQITITDGEIRASLLNDRAQGGSSLNPGEIEVMLHRRMLYDDGFGVDEALNEMQDHEGLRARGRHYFTLTTVNSQIIERSLANTISLEPWIFLSDNHSDMNLDIQHEFTAFQGMRHLHESVKLLTLEPLSGEKDKLLLRLENFDDSKEVTVDLKDMFKKFDIVSLEEMNLAGNLRRSDVQRLRWNDFFNEGLTPQNGNGPLQFTLNPFEIKTLIARVNYK